MKEITLENFRCFHTRQVARLAPLTLLMGDNGTGKTSFLAMIRALWDCVYGHRIPNFKEKPFDLGSFVEVAHRQNERNRPASTFKAGLQIAEGLQGHFEFAEKNAALVPVKTCLGDNGAWIEESHDSDGTPRIYVRTSRGIWGVPRIADTQGSVMSLLTSRRSLPLIAPEMFYPEYLGKTTNLSPLDGSPDFSQKDFQLTAGFRLLGFESDENRPFASAPVRSIPRRTHDLASLTSDPEGVAIPTLLARLAWNNDHVWKNFKRKLEQFGSNAGIFDEINVKHLGKSASAPFQIQVSMYGKKRKGPKQNLIDVGYGISQILPTLAELLLPSDSRMALLQQPEAHLHPRAQAALGSLFCEIAGRGRQLVIETHSDHLMDRVRMDVRDGKANLKPEDVSILFFERNDVSVQIHSIRLDEEGNILDAPQSYRRFFMEEITRSLGL